MKFAELTLTGVSIKFRTSLAGNSCLITPSNHQKNSARVPRWIRIGASEARMVSAWIYMQKEISAMGHKRTRAAQKDRYRSPRRR